MLGANVYIFVGKEIVTLVTNMETKRTVYCIDLRSEERRVGKECW